MEDPEELEALVNHQRQGDLELDSTKNASQLREDLKRMLPPKAFKAVALLLDFAEPSQEMDFEKSLIARGLQRQQLSCTKLKLLIERHLGIKVFAGLRNSRKLSQYLRG